MPGQRYAQAKYWLLTVPSHMFTPFLPNGVCSLRGQLESGNETGYLHWQLLVCFARKMRLAGVKNVFGDGIHAEPSRSEAANDYVWKEETRVEGTQFELGKCPFRRNSSTDWESVWDAAKAGRIEEIPADVRVRSYAALERIEKEDRKSVV